MVGFKEAVLGGLVSLLLAFWVGFYALFPIMPVEWFAVVTAFLTLLDIAIIAGGFLGWLGGK